MREQDRPHLAKDGPAWVVWHNRRERRPIGPAFVSFAAVCIFANALASLREAARGASHA